MPTLSSKIAYPIIIAGFFVIVSFIALNYETLNFSFYIIFFFLAAYLFLFGFAIGQNFTAPVKKLLKKADDLSKGDLKSRFYAESKDEIGQLSDAFNRIADKLEESDSEIEKTKKSVGIKVEAETQSLKEIINALEQKVQNRTMEIQKMVGDLEKFKEFSNTKEAEATDLKNQIAELKSRLEKRGGRSHKNTEEKEKPPKIEHVEKEKPVRAERAEKDDDDGTSSKTQALKETINNLEQKVQSRTVQFQKVAGDLEKFQKYSKSQEEEIAKLEEKINKMIKKSDVKS